MRSLKVSVFSILLLVASSADAQSFTQAQIGQNNPLAGASNRFTVTLVTDTSLTASASSAVTLSGLGSASTQSGNNVALLESAGGNSAEQLFEKDTRHLQRTGCSVGARGCGDPRGGTLACRSRC